MKNRDLGTSNSEAFLRSNDIVGKKIVLWANLIAVVFFVLGLSGINFLFDKFNESSFLWLAFVLLLSFIAIIVALLIFTGSWAIIDWEGRAQRFIKAEKK